MDTQRVRSGGVRRPAQPSSRGDSFRPEAVLVYVVLGAAFLLPGTAAVVSAPGGASAEPPPASTATTDPTVAPESSTLSEPRTIEQLLALVDARASKARFNGQLLGWRIASYEALRAEGISGRNLSRTCEPREVGAETPTALDLEVGYLPPNLRLGRIAGPIKWVCDQEALSVLYVYNVATPLGNGQISFERSIEGRRTIEMNVPSDSVETSTIDGKPAIIFHFVDDATGFGDGRVVVIEDDIGPEFQILSVAADNGVPLDELIKTAEGVR